MGNAYDTYTSEDVICEIAMGKNTNPSCATLKKIIELHRSVRHDLYREVIKKIVAEYLTAEKISEEKEKFPNSGEK